MYKYLKGLNFWTISLKLKFLSGFIGVCIILT